MQGWYIGITAASQAVKAGSTPVPCSKTNSYPIGWLFVLVAVHGGETVKFADRQISGDAALAESPGF